QRFKTPFGQDVHRNFMLRSNRRHLAQLSMNELDALVFVKYAGGDHAVVLANGDLGSCAHRSTAAKSRFSGFTAPSNQILVDCPKSRANHEKKFLAGEQQVSF